MATQEEKRIARLEGELAAAKNDGAAQGRVQLIQRQLDNATGKLDDTAKTRHRAKLAEDNKVPASSSFVPTEPIPDYYWDGPEGEIEAQPKFEYASFKNQFLGANPLNEYDQVTYHVEWFFCPENEVRKYQQQSDASLKRKELKNRLTILETAVTSQFSLNSLEFETICGSESTNRGPQTTKITLEMFENQGLTLFDKLLEMGRFLDIKRIMNVPSFINVYWNGIDKDGTPVEKIGNYDFLWPVTVTKIKPELDIAGTAYTVDMFHMSDESLNPGLVKMQEKIDFEAADLEEFLLNLETELNKRTFRAKGYWMPFMKDIKPLEGRAEINKFMKFKFDTLLEQLQELKFITGTDQVTVGTFNEKKKFSLTADQDLRTVINAALIEVVTGMNEIDLEGKETPDFKKLINFNKSIEYGLYISETNEYTKSATYDFFLSDISRMIERIQKKDDPEEKSKKNLEKIVSLDLLKRMYTYNFSGQNIDVLSLDVNFDNLWAITMSSDTFNVQENSSTSKDAKERRVTKDIEEVDITKLDIQSLYRLYAQQADESWFDSFGDSGETASEIKRRNAALEQSADEQALSNEELSKKFPGGRLLLEQLPPEEMQASSKNKEQDVSTTPATIISYDQNLDQFTITPPDIVSSKSRLRASIVEQTFIDGSAGTFLKFNMEVRGDPYWIGNPEETEYEQSDSIATAKYTRGEHSFIFEYDTPRQINEDTGLMEKDSGYLLKGLYNVLTVTSSFSEGRFTQKITAVRNTEVKL